MTIRMMPDECIANCCLEVLLAVSQYGHMQLWRMLRARIAGALNLCTP